MEKTKRDWTERRTDIYANGQKRTGQLTEWTNGVDRKTYNEKGSEQNSKGTKREQLKSNSIPHSATI